MNGGIKSHWVHIRFDRTPRDGPQAKIRTISWWMNRKPARKSWDLESLEWQDIGTDGTKHSLLEGRRDTPGHGFTYAFFIPAGFWDPAANARVVVLKGTLDLGYGVEMDRSKLEAFPTGSMVLVPANAKHFDGCDKDTLIVSTVIGPWNTPCVNSSVQASAGTI
jgi:hypothetical protein